MKKLIFAAALAAVCVPAFAEDDAGISSSIVGYVTVEGVKSAQYVPLAVQFENVAGGDIAVKDVVTVSAPQGGAMAAADQIWRWNTASASWTKYFLYTSARAGVLNQWRKDGEEVETTDTIPCGETFFFMRAPGTAGTVSLTLAGGVRDLSSSTSFTVKSAELAFVANPWPKAIAIKDFCQYSDGAWQGGAMAAADQIWLWDTEDGSWTKYFLYTSARAGILNQWRKEGEDIETTDEIPVGKGIFFQRAPGTEGTFTVTFADKK